MSATSRSSGKQALIVLGMHRSGTSALAGVLAKLGAQAPGTPIPATKNNPRGFWESRELMHFHDRILELADSRWSDWQKIDSCKLADAVSGNFVSELSALLHEEYGDAPLLLVKDPRMCRLFPLWNNALRELEIAPKVIIPFRHPLEVARSLEARNKFGRYQSLLLWLRHVLDAESDTRGVKRVFLEYSDLLSDWRMQVDRLSRELDIHWPGRSAEAVAAIDAYLAPELRHHQAPAVRHETLGLLDEWISATHRCLQRLVQDPDCLQTFRGLDEIRNKLDQTVKIYAPMFAEQQQRLSETDALMRSLKKKTGEQGRLLASSELSRQQEAEFRDQLTAEVSRLSARVSKLKKARLDSLRSFEKERIAWTSREDEMVVSIDALRRERAGFARGQQIMQSEMDAQREVIADYRARLEEVEASRLWGVVRKLRASAGNPCAGIREAVENVADDTLLKQSKLFDADWYLSTYTDVQASGMDPTAHFLSVGAGEGRNPCAIFNTKSYISRYQDVAEAGVNPLIHYLQYGRREGRRPFDEVCNLGREEA